MTRLDRTVSYAFILIATIALVVGYIKLDNNQQAILAVNRRICQAVVLITPQIKVGRETDPPALQRIRDMNRARAQARAMLTKTLACDV